MRAMAYALYINISNNQKLTIMKRYCSKNRFLLMSSALVVLLNSCTKDRGDRDPHENITFDKVIYMDDAPTSFSLKEGKNCISADTLPVRDFIIYDSLMLVETNKETNFLEVRSLEDLSLKGGMLNKGNASGEFLWGPSLSHYSTFVQQNGSLYAIIYDEIVKKFYTLNITASINSGMTQITEAFDKVKSPGPMFWAKFLPDSTFYVKVLADEETKERRWILRDDKTEAIQSMGKDDLCAVKKGEDFNLLGSFLSMSPDRNRCVEAMLFQNYINVYSLTDDDGYTICCGKKLDKLSDISALPRENRTMQFGDLRSHEFGFAVMKNNLASEAKASQETTPSILLFNWKGKVLGELKPDVRFRRFDIDEANNLLYVLTDDGSILQYVIPLKLG